MATMVAMIRPDLTPVGHAGTDVNRAVASDQLAIRKGQGSPVIIGDHGPTMGAWNSKGEFMVTVPNRGSVYAAMNKGQTMQSQTAQALIDEANRFHSNDATILALPLTSTDALELSERLGFEVPAGLVITAPMTTTHTIDWDKVDAILNNDNANKVFSEVRDKDTGEVTEPARFKTNRQVVSETVVSLLNQRLDVIVGMHDYADKLQAEIDNSPDSTVQVKNTAILEMMQPALIANPRLPVDL